MVAPISSKNQANLQTLLKSQSSLVNPKFLPGDTGIKRQLTNEEKLQNGSQGISEYKIAEEDRRVRIKLKSIKAWNTIFGQVLPTRPGQTPTGARTNFISPLHPVLGKTKGVIFPYTPVINYNYVSEWSPMALVHTNYQNESFSRSYPSEITVAGQFSAQDEEEARYAYAVIHFFRTVTKMFYGNNDSQLAGTPPPTLLLSGHGNGMFNDIPVIVKQFSHELLNDADYIRVPLDTGEAWVPSLFNVIITLGVQQNLIKVRDEFSLKKFGSGELLNKGKGYL